MTSVALGILPHHRTPPRRCRNLMRTRHFPQSQLWIFSKDALGSDKNSTELSLTSFRGQSA